MNNQPALPKFAPVAIADRSRKSIGTMGERHAAALLEKQGYEVSFTRYGEKRGDLRAINCKTGEVHYIEVKTARRCKDGKWRFLLHKKGHQDHRQTDTIMLLAVLKSGRIICFVVPTDILKNQSQAVITSHPENYAGKLAQYRTKGEICL